MNISVCLASFNGERYICRQLRSILPQLAGDDEVVIVDDASTDGTVTSIASLQDDRIRVIRNTANKGPAKSFEKALSEARGHVVFLSDQDDVWLPGKVERMVAILRSGACSALVSDARLIDEHDVVIGKSFFEIRNSGPGITKNFYKNTYLGCCMAMTREAVEWALPFPDGIPQHDAWIGLVCDIMDQVGFLREPLVLYRRHDSNVTRLSRSNWLSVVNYRVATVRSLIKWACRRVCRRLGSWTCTRAE